MHLYWNTLSVKNQEVNFEMRYPGSILLYLVGKDGWREGTLGSVLTTLEGQDLRRMRALKDNTKDYGVYSTLMILS